MGGRGPGSRSCAGSARLLSGVAVEGPRSPGSQRSWRAASAPRGRDETALYQTTAVLARRAPARRAGLRTGRGRRGARLEAGDDGGEGIGRESFCDTPRPSFPHRPGREGPAVVEAAPEHLVALALQAGGARRRERAWQLLEAGAVDRERLRQALTTHAIAAEIPDDA